MALLSQDILEGVGPVLMRLMIQEIMNVHNLSIDFVNNRIQNFNNKPADIRNLSHLFLIYQDMQSSSLNCNKNFSICLLL
jgi:hypothetical protein